MTYLAASICDDDIGSLVPWGSDEPETVDRYMLQTDPTEFRKFVAQHNWRDLVAMATLTEYVT